MLSFRNGLLLFTAPLLLAHGAHAQSPSCELLKQTLASRIPPEIKGYAMDDVPARTPVPSGGKVIGTCEGGARKVIYRRFGGPPLVVDGAAGTGPTTPTATSAPANAALQPRETPKPAPVVPPKPVPPPVASAPAAPVVAKPAPVAATPKPASPPASAPAPAARPAPVASAPAPVAKPAKSSLAETPAAPLTTRATPAPQPVEPAAVPLSPPPAADDGEPGFFSAYGTWLWLLLALPLVAWLWAWVSHRMAYDEAGLPRGPRL